MCCSWVKAPRMACGHRRVISSQLAGHYDVSRIGESVEETTRLRAVRAFVSTKKDAQLASSGSRRAHNVRIVGLRAPGGFPRRGASARSTCPATAAAEPSAADGGARRCGDAAAAAHQARHRCSVRACCDTRGRCADASLGRLRRHARAAGTRRLGGRQARGSEADGGEPTARHAGRGGARVRCRSRAHQRTQHVRRALHNT